MWPTSEIDSIRQEDAVSRIADALGTLERKRRKLERQIAGLTRVGIVRERDHLWSLLLDGSAVVESATGAAPRLQFHLRPTRGSGFRVLLSRLGCAVAARLRRFLAREVPGILIPEATVSESSSSAEPLALDDEVFRAVQCSALGFEFAETLGDTEDRTRYVGMLYRDFKDQSFNRRLRESFNDLAELLHGQGSTQDWKRILLIVGPPRIGKSYTALYHLFIRYCLGEQVFRLPLMADDPEIERLLNRLRKLRAEGLETKGERPMQWVFLEDPFGTISSRRRNYRTFSHYLQELINAEVGIAITSRAGPWENARKRLDLRDMEDDARISIHVLGEPLKEADAPLRQTRQERSLYSEDALARMVIDYASLTEARWVQQSDQHEAVRAWLTMPEGVTIYPADIVLWSALPSALNAPSVREALGRLPGIAQVERALSEEMCLLIPTEERMAFALPQLVLLDWGGGRRLADVLGLGTQWEYFRTHSEDLGLIAARPAQRPEAKDDNGRRPWHLRQINYCYVFHEDLAEAISFHIHRTHSGLALLTGSLDRFFAHEPASLAALDPYLIVELIRRRTLAAAYLAPTPESVPPKARAASPAAARRWLDAERRATLDNYLNAAEQAGRPAAQIERAQVILHLLTVIESLAVGEEHAERAESWRCLEEAVRTGGLPALAALGHALGDALRSSSQCALLAEPEFVPTIARDTGPGPFREVMVRALVLGAVVEAVSEEMGAIPALSRLHKGLGEARPARTERDIRGLVWRDILVWMIGSVRTHLRDAALAWDIDKRSIDGAVKLLEWLTGEFIAVTNRLPLDEYVTGWTLAILAWHHDWQRPGPMDVPRSARQAQRKSAEAREALAGAWREAFAVYERLNGVQREEVFQGFFDNAAYHATYLKVQTSEWSRLAALGCGTPADKAPAMHDAGAARDEDGPHSEPFWDQQNRLWREAFHRAREMKGNSVRRTWGAPSDLEDFLAPPDALTAIGLLLGCRAGTTKRGRGRSAAVEFRDWLSSRLGDKASASDRTLWGLAIELYRQGFFDDLPDGKSLQEQSDTLRNFWRSQRQRYLDSGVVPNETFLAGADEWFNRLPESDRDR